MQTSVWAATSGEGETSMEDRPLDVSRNAIGSTLFSVTESEAKEDGFPILDTSDSLFLVSDDEVLSSEGKKGLNEYLLTITGRNLVYGFSFFNYFGSGSVTLEGLTQTIINRSQDWDPIAKDVAFSGTGPVHIEMPVPKKYRAIKISINVVEEGEFSGFGVSGNFTADQFEKMEINESPEDTTMNSVITPSQISRIAGVTESAPGAETNDPELMIDDLVETTYTFDTGKSLPAVLMDLGRDRKIERITALVTTDVPAYMQVYMLPDVEDAAPGDEERALIWPTQPAFASTSLSSIYQSLFPMTAAFRIQELVYADPDSLEGLQPIAVMECSPDDPRVTIELDGVYTSRFVLIRWIPIEEGTPLGGFIVHEINLLGRYTWRFYDPVPSLDSGETPPILIRELPRVSP
ncbi:MAG: hypothetical protein AAFY98_08305 [Verrucomicrobiota bacterium]